MSSKTRQSNEELARAIPERIASGKELDLLEEFLTADYVEHSPMGAEHGIAEARAGMERIHAAFPDLQVTVEDIVERDDTVAMRLTIRGTHEGPFVGIEPTGERFEIQNMVFTRIEDGRIAERWVLPDMLAMFQQLGVVDVALPTP